MFWVNYFQLVLSAVTVLLFHKEQAGSSVLDYVETDDWNVMVGEPIPSGSN
jgi:hypothetical protein